MTTNSTRFIAEVRERVSRATPGPNYLERHEGLRNDNFRYEVTTGRGFVAFYEENYDEPMRAKFDAQLFQKAKADLAKLTDALEVALGALKTGIGYEPLSGIEPRPFSEAQQKIETLLGEK